MWFETGSVKQSIALRSAHFKRRVPPFEVLLAGIHVKWVESARQNGRVVILLADEAGAEKLGKFLAQGLQTLVSAVHTQSQTSRLRNSLQGLNVPCPWQSSLFQYRLNLDTLS